MELKKVMELVDLLVRFASRRSVGVGHGPGSVAGGMPARRVRQDSSLSSRGGTVPVARLDRLVMASARAYWCVR